MKSTEILVVFIALAGCLSISSCGCCTGEERPPKLRKLPKFNDVPTPVVVEDMVEPAK